jgi:acetylornithine deacetylase/succinyl-diaminopimelate desuccinylase-like protein
VLDRALELARAGRREAERDLFEELAIPSVSTLPEHRDDCLRNAGWLVDRLRAIGFEAALHDTVPGGLPVLRADWLGRPGAPVATIYGHYDVQPADPIQEWRSPPFEPVARGGDVYARGAADNKGNHMAVVKALEHLAAAGGPPVNVRLLLEGEEEITGPSLPRYLLEHAGELATDCVVLLDGSFTPDGRPSLYAGLRGLLYVELVAQGTAFDVHSGGYGGVAPNAATTLARVVGSLIRPDGVVAIPGFYDAVREPEPAEVARWHAPADLEGELLRLTGASRLEGDQRFGARERIWSRPSLDVNGFLSGFVGEGKKTVIPARAAAKVSMRLVPDQDSAAVLESLRAHVAGMSTAGVTVEVKELGSSPPVLCGIDHTGAQAMTRAFAAAFGEEPVVVRSGGSIPVATDFQATLGAPMVITGVVQPGGGAHGPNEHLRLENFHRGTELIIRFLYEMSP